MSRVEEQDVRSSNSARIVGKLTGWGLFEPFTKYGLLGCCVGFICLALWYQQNQTSKMLAWTLEEIQNARMEAKEELRDTRQESRQERERTWKEVASLRSTMNEALLEIRSGRQAVAKVQADVTKAADAADKAAKVGDEIRKGVGAVKKAVENMEP